MKMKWISVKEQMPTNDDPVLVANVYTVDLSCIGKPSEQGQHVYITMFNDDLRRDPQNITHWMPLPIPPPLPFRQCDALQELLEQDERDKQFLAEHGAKTMDLLAQADRLIESMKIGNEK